MTSRNAPSGCVAPSPATAAPPSPTNLRLTVGQSGSESANEPGSEPEDRILQDGYWEYGRFYGSWKKGKYNFPIDKVCLCLAAVYAACILTSLFRRRQIG